MSRTGTEQNAIERDMEVARKGFLYRDLQRETGVDKCHEATLSWEQCGNILRRMEQQFKKRIKGQDKMVHQLTLALVLNEHALLEGLPGTGKTEMIKAVSEVTGLPYQRVQFVPDMLPSDLIGRDTIDVALLNQEDPRAVHWVNGPLFSGLVLADEINRAPSKVQAALLEAMGEAQITPMGKEARKVWSPIHRAAVKAWLTRFSERSFFGLAPINPDLKFVSHFNVLATMNPIEQEGTYPLSEAQIDRFCFKIDVSYPDIAYYQDILQASFAGEKPEKPKTVRGNAEEEAYLAYFRDCPEGDLEAVLAPLYFFLLCRDAIFGYFGDPGQALSHHFQNSIQKDKIFHMVFFSHFNAAAASGSIHNNHEGQDLQDALERHAAALGRGGLGRNARHGDWLRGLQGITSELVKQEVFQYLVSGSGPRGFLKLTKVVLAEALFHYKGAPYFDDRFIRAHAADVLKHRIRLNVHARLEGFRSEMAVNALCNIFLE